MGVGNGLVFVLYFLAGQREKEGEGVLEGTFKDLSFRPLETHGMSQWVIGRP